jgi:hypothetical protein
VPPELFDTPVPLSMSGGTAQFFKLSYVGPQSGPNKERYGKSPTYWLGKDVARALDELPFYEDIRKLNKTTYKLLSRWTMAYEGIVSKPVADSPTDKKAKGKTRDLLVIHDISDGLKDKRMLDIKIGEETAVGGWQGKSEFGAATNRIVDRSSNSSVQGFRLEGFDNPPESLSTQDFGDQDVKTCACFTKKYKRITYQRFTAREFLRYWLDFNDQIYLETSTSLTAVEYSEAVLFDACRQLAELCSDALKMPVPQMWIGSSLCLACDSGKLPERLKTLQLLAQDRRAEECMAPTDLAKVCVFDWGRSELNTIEKNATLQLEEQAQRQKYWDIWERGLIRAWFEAVNLYISQFQPAPVGGPFYVTISAWDYDTYDPCDFLGFVVLPLQETEQDDFELSDLGGRGCGSVSVSISRLQLPSQSRLSEAWRVYVAGVDDLPKADLFSDTDPLIRVDVGSDRDEDTDWRIVGMSSSAWTPVIYNDRNAEIDKSLDFGFAKPEVLNSLMTQMSRPLGMNLGAKDFTIPDRADRTQRQQCFEDFLARIGGKMTTLSRAPDQTLLNSDSFEYAD